MRCFVVEGRERQRVGCSALNTLASVQDGGLVSVRMCFFHMWPERVIAEQVEGGEESC